MDKYPIPPSLIATPPASTASAGGTTLPDLSSASRYGSTKPSVPARVENKLQKAEKAGAKAVDRAKEKLDDAASSSKAALHRAVATGRRAIGNAKSEVDTLIETRPYVVIGALSGVTFGLGLLFGSKVTRWLALLAGGCAVVLAGESNLWKNLPPSH
jgi:ElaB/YqjD/DUF883 family membrane-anchored ribosome-binding protein